MTDSELDDVLWRADTCPDTLTLEQVRAAWDELITRGIEHPNYLVVAYVLRKLSI
jgi:hypothetical protein